MEYSAENELLELIKSYPALKPAKDDIWDAYLILWNCFQNEHKLMICGNGGSSADSGHMMGELMKGFRRPRALPKDETKQLEQAFGKQGELLAQRLQDGLETWALCDHTALMTAITNDTGADMVYAQQVYAAGKKGDVLLGISTSGNAENIINAMMVARTFGLKTIGLTAKTGGGMKGLCDALICVPGEETYRIQEYHLPVYHCLCRMLEEEFFVNNDS